eukprot:403375200
MGGDQSRESGVSNNGFFRGVSNTLDAVPAFKDSGTRAYIHGKYHDRVADQKEAAGNHAGAAAERNRAQQQYQRAAEKSPKRY